MVYASTRDTCRLCDARALELALPLTPTPVGDAYVTQTQCQQIQPAYSLDLMRCARCGNVQLREVVDANVLYDHYTYRTSVSLGLVEHFHAYADEVMHRFHPPSEGFVVEIGSNEGTLLAAFRKHGMRVLGVDPCRALAEHATREGMETLPAFFTAALARELHRQRGPAAVVCANNVLANIDDVRDVVQGVRELLAPDGLFVFETSYLLDVVHGLLLDTIFHEHLSYLSVTPLERFFRRHGMELISVQRVSTKGGSLRGIAQLAGGSRRPDASISELMALERQVGLDGPRVFSGMAEKIGAIGQQLGTALRDPSLQEYGIAGYGAAVGLTTLVYQFQLGETLAFLVDDNPDKQHLFSPGFHLPVLPSHALYERRPAAVVLLAWRYAPTILGRHEAYLRQGGRVVIPLPRINVVTESQRGVAAAVRP